MRIKEYYNLPFVSVNAIVTLLVKHLPFILISEYLIGPIDFLVKFTWVLISLILIRMVFSRKFPILFLYFSFSGASFQLQNFIVIVAVSVLVALYAFDQYSTYRNGKYKHQKWEPHISFPLKRVNHFFNCVFKKF